MNMAPVARTPESLPPNMTPASLSPASLAPDVAVSLASSGVVATLWLTPQLEMSPTCRNMSPTTHRVAPILAKWVRVADTIFSMSWQFVSAQADIY